MKTIRINMGRLGGVYVLGGTGKEDAVLMCQ